MLHPWMDVFFLSVMKGHVSVMMRAAPPGAASLPTLIHFPPPAQRRLRPAGLLRRRYHPGGFLTTNLPARFNKESAHYAILTVNLLRRYANTGGKKRTAASAAAVNDCRRKDETRDGEDLRRSSEEEKLSE